MLCIVTGAKVVAISCHLSSPEKIRTSTPRLTTVGARLLSFRFAPHQSPAEVQVFTVPTFPEEAAAAKEDLPNERLTVSKVLKVIELLASSFAAVVLVC